MGDVEQIQQQQQATFPDGFSRRTFIKGVIATGASVSASSYVFRDGTVARAQAAGSVKSASARARAVIWTSSPSSARSSVAT